VGGKDVYRFISSDSIQQETSNFALIVRKYAVDALDSNNASGAFWAATTAAKTGTHAR
jgi:hypothetical protein